MARGCCRRSEDGGGAVQNTLFLGAALGLSFLFLVLAAAIYKDYYPFLNICFVVLVPIAVIVGDSLAGGSGGGIYSESSSAWANMGHCFFGTVLISMFGLPLVLLYDPALNAYVQPLVDRYLGRLESGLAGPGRTDSGWLNRALGQLPPGQRIQPPKGGAPQQPNGLGVGTVTPLILRGAAPTVDQGAAIEIRGAGIGHGSPGLGMSG